MNSSKGIVHRFRQISGDLHISSKLTVPPSDNNWSLHITEFIFLLFVSQWTVTAWV